MNKFLNSCKRCLNPWIVAIVIVVIGGLIVFVPIIGITTSIAALPILGCTIMCGAMAFFMKDKKAS